MSCDQCLPKFDDNGGCDCLKSDDCDVLTYVVDGCWHCEEEAYLYCYSDPGKFMVYMSLFI